MRRIPKLSKYVGAEIEGGDVHDLEPGMALIVHRERRHGGAACCTIHGVETGKGGRPRLAPGRLATAEELSDALAELKDEISAGGAQTASRRESGFTRRDIVYRGKNGVAWLRPASVETLLIGGDLDASYSRRRMAIPEMVLHVENNHLRTLCALEPGRPGPETKVCAAPFPNTGPRGDVCLNGRLNFEQDTPEFELKVEELYLNTTFTHPNMSHPLNTNAKLKRLWEEAISRAAKGEPLKPKDFLTPDYPKFKLKEALKNVHYA